jgi:hypothetical protein
MLGPMNPDPPEPSGALMTRDRLAEIVHDIDAQGPSEAEALLLALISASWPTRWARDH